MNCASSYYIVRIDRRLNESSIVSAGECRSSLNMKAGMLNDLVVEQQYGGDAGSWIDDKKNRIENVVYADKYARRLHPKCFSESGDAVRECVDG